MIANTAKNKTIIALCVGLTASIGSYFYDRNWVLSLEVGWIVFAIIFLWDSYRGMKTKTAAQMKAYAAEMDGSNRLVGILVIVTAFLALLSIILLNVVEVEKKFSAVYIAVSFLSIILSWVMIHTIYTFHYAHLYYSPQSKQAIAGLLFPENYTEPVYIDFLYFSFTVGMTFQDSDIAAGNTSMRKVVLVHSLLSFAINTFVVALLVSFFSSVLHR